MLRVPYYLTPEVCGNRPYGCPSDMWLLGCLLYELLSLRHMFSDDGATDVLLRLLQGVCTPLDQSYSPGLRQLVAQLLQPNPRARPTAEAVLRLPLIQNRVSAFIDDIIMQRASAPAQRATTAVVESTLRGSDGRERGQRTEERAAGGPVPVSNSDPISSKRRVSENGTSSARRRPALRLRTAVHARAGASTTVYEHAHAHSSLSAAVRLTARAQILAARHWPPTPTITIGFCLVSTGSLYGDGRGKRP